MAWLSAKLSASSTKGAKTAAWEGPSRVCCSKITCESSDTATEQTEVEVSMWRMQDMAEVFSASSFRDSNGRETDARFSICEFKAFRLIHKVSTAKSRAAPCIRRTARANLPEYHPTARNVPAPHPASRHVIARVLHATRWGFTSSSRPDAAPSAAPTKTRRDVSKSS